MNDSAEMVPSGRHRTESGAAMVEFAFVGVLLILLLLGIVVMGLLLSFKQNITQAAAEGARSVVGVVDDPSTPPVADGPVMRDDRDDLVLDTLDTVVAEYTDSGCGTSGISCDWKIHPCTADTSPFDLLLDDRSSNQPECITVRVEFANSGSTRLLPKIPLISNLEPNTLASQSTGRLRT